MTAGGPARSCDFGDFAGRFRRTKIFFAFGTQWKNCSVKKLRDGRMCYAVWPAAGARPLRNRRNTLR
jgi:hypothetical protein